MAWSELQKNEPSADPSLRSMHRQKLRSGSWYSLNWIFGKRTMENYKEL
uniref:Uncharacterized protein n=1 Tax=Physcomitrium patens TaxID=3218 RepID=A0A2K1IJS3_PHYPA|nr:hypothetical protein PHYPA_028215 [Physcomitrium patens]